MSKQVSKVYPQAVFLPIRTMYFTLKIEQRERYKIAEQSGKPVSSWKKKKMLNFVEISKTNVL
jgi:hypothetical protein